MDISEIKSKINTLDINIVAFRKHVLPIKSFIIVIEKAINMSNDQHTWENNRYTYIIDSLQNIINNELMNNSSQLDNTLINKLKYCQHQLISIKTPREVRNTIVPVTSQIPRHNRHIYVPFYDWVDAQSLCSKSKKDIRNAISKLEQGLGKKHQPSGKFFYQNQYLLIYGNINTIKQILESSKIFEKQVNDKSHGKLSWCIQKVLEWRESQQF